MHTIEELNQLIDSAISRIELNGEPQNLYLPIAHVLKTGGKRLRPTLTLAACNLFTNQVDDAIDAALAVEVFHNFTLVHDDIMDNADLRRGVITVHKKWNTNTAILSGDAMVVLAYKLLAKTRYDALPQVFDAFNTMAIDVCRGQQYDMDFEQKTQIDRRNYLDMIELKTAALLRGAVEIGAIIGQASTADLQALQQYALNLGLAFQLQDDLLDVYGDTNVFGKNIGGDILEQKKTILTIETRKMLEPNDLADFDKTMHDRNTPPDEKIARITQHFNRAGTKKHVEKMVDNYFANAMQCLDQLSVNNERKLVMKGLTNKILKRNK